jgi:hypothetical protein
LILDEHDWHDQATEMAHTLHEYENKQSHLLRQRFLVQDSVLCNFLQRAITMPRRLKADILTENEQLRMRLAELETPRTRSRSPRRQAESADKTRRVLNLVCQFERDAVIADQEATIVRQQMEIQNLKEGGGRIGEVLLAIRRKQCPQLVTNFVIEQMGRSTMSVAEWFDTQERLTRETHNMTFWGRSDYTLKYTRFTP